MANIQPPKKKLKILFHAMDGTGHLNACVGIAEALTKRGHSVLFLVNEAFQNQFSKYGFEEQALVRNKNKGGEGTKKGGPDSTSSVERENPVKTFARMMVNSGMLNKENKTPLERVKEMAEKRAKGDDGPDFALKMYEPLVDFNPQIKKAIQDKKPDLFILDHFLVPPALPESGIPWLYCFSGNPLAIYGSKDLPPFTTGYPTNSDRALWEEFLSYQNEMGNSFAKYQKKLYEDFGFEAKEEHFPLSNGGFFPQCKYGYIYGYPKELNYQDLIPIPEDKFIGMDAFCRETKPTEPFKLPEGFASKDDKLIFFSLGSMGSADIELVLKVTRILSKTPYKTIVSKGPMADEYELPENCWGEGYLPQTQILPLVDLVITHGGNNTVTETFSFGKPMIVLPLFGDQLDNAQRVHEKGFGRRLETYKFTDEELVEAVESLINDQQLKERLEKAAKRIKADRSKEVACMKIEAIAEKYAK